MEKRVNWEGYFPITNNRNVERIHAISGDLHPKLRVQLKNFLSYFDDNILMYLVKIDHLYVDRDLTFWNHKRVNNPDDMIKIVIQWHPIDKVYLRTTITRYGGINLELHRPGDSYFCMNALSDSTSYSYEDCINKIKSFIGNG